MFYYLFLHSISSCFRYQTFLVTIKNLCWSVMLKCFRINHIVFCCKYIRYRQYAVNSSHKQPTNLYDVLKVTPQCSQQQIKSAYYKLCIVLHPDKNVNTSEDHKRFIQITEAYKVLSDPIAKKTYDRSRLIRQDPTQGYIHPTEIRGHPNVSHGNKYDLWTKLHYQEQLNLRNQRYQNDRLRKEWSEDVQHGMQVRFLTIFAMLGCIVVVKVIYFVKKKWKGE